MSPLNDDDIYRGETHDVHHDKVVCLSDGLVRALGVQGALQGGGAQGGVGRVDLGGERDALALIHHSISSSASGRFRSQNARGHRGSYEGG